MAMLVMLRHGQSVWNLENKFTGWVDVELTSQGQNEANEAGKKIAALNPKFQKAHTSRLKRAQNTLRLVLDQVGQKPETWIDSALNERHYGDLQGLNKDEMRTKYGEQQVHIWRRSYDVPPPNGECLADTAKRSIPYFREYVLPDLKAGKDVLIAAHGNSLRSIIMFIEGLSKEQILELNLDTGVPYTYEFNATGAVSSKNILR